MMMTNQLMAAGNRQQWQYAYRQFNQRISTRGRGHDRGRNTSQNTSRTHPSRRSENTAAEDTIQVEYLPPANTTGLIEKVRAAIYLTIDEL